MAIITYNPTTGEELNEYSVLNVSQIDAKVRAANSEFISWRKAGFEHRTKLMVNAANILRERKEELAVLAALEMGKPLAQGRAEVEKCAFVCDYYSQNAERFLSPKHIATEASKSYVAYNPIGTVLAIMPWNFPFWQVFRFAAPALCAGNTALLKHSSNTMGCAFAIEKVFVDAGFPESCFINLAISGAQAEELISHSGVAAVTLTGSTPVGAKVAAAAGRNIKKTVLELGGSDPYIILADADIESAANICAAGRLINSGQSCIAAKRFIAVESVKEEFAEALCRAFDNYNMGDPLDESKNVGPQARADLQDELFSQIDRSVGAGAKLIYGGKRIDSSGYFVEPTILSDVDKNSPIYYEETFGPVAAIISANNIEHAVEIANDTIFGLGAAIFSRDIELAERIAREELNAGACFVNDNVKSDPRLPFGGIKQSGYGRELAEEGIKEFVNVKTVVVK